MSIAIRTEAVKMLLRRRPDWTIGEMPKKWKERFGGYDYAVIDPATKRPIVGMHKKVS